MSRAAFWLLLPFLAIFVCGMLWVDFFTGAINTAGGRVLAAGICVVIGTLGLAFYDSERFWWAGRFVAAFVFFAYASYIIDEWFFSGHRWNYAMLSHSAASPVNSVLGMIAYGVPAFWYVFTGKFHRRGNNDVTSYEYTGDEDGDEDQLDEAGEEPDDRKHYERRHTP